MIFSAIITTMSKCMLGAREVLEPRVVQVSRVHATRKDSPGRLRSRALLLVSKNAAGREAKEDERARERG